MVKATQQHLSATQQRNHRGWFRGSLSNAELMEAVSEVAQVANPTDPFSVSTRAWDGTRSRVEGGQHLPTARAIGMRLNAGRVGRRSWSDIVRAAVSEDGVGEPDAAKRSAKNKHLGLDHLYYGLRRVARELEPGIYLARDNYTLARDMMIARDPRGQMAMLIPNENQIERITLAVNGRDEEAESKTVPAGTWNEALALADLPSERPKPTGSGGGSRVELLGLRRDRAVEEFLQANGGWPTAIALQEFARTGNFVLAPPGKGRGTWQALIDQVAARWVDSGRWCPARGARYPRGAKPTVHPPMEPIPDAPMRGEDRYRVAWTRDRCLEVMRKFSRKVAETPKLRPTQKTYNGMAPKRGWPTSAVFQNHGGFTVMRVEAERLNAAEDRRIQSRTP